MSDKIYLPEDLLRNLVEIEAHDLRHVGSAVSSALELLHTTDLSVSEKVKQDALFHSERMLRHLNESITLLTLAARMNASSDRPYGLNFLDFKSLLTERVANVDCVDCPEDGTEMAIAAIVAADTVDLWRGTFRGALSIKRVILIGADLPKTIEIQFEVVDDKFAAFTETDIAKALGRRPRLYRDSLLGIRGAAFAHAIGWTSGSWKKPLPNAVALKLSRES